MVFFLKFRGDLDIEAMRDAGKRLVGEKDFRNFCKMDVGNGVVTFLRRIDNITINVLDNEPNMYDFSFLFLRGFEGNTTQRSSYNRKKNIYIYFTVIFKYSIDFNGVRVDFRFFTNLLGK